MADLIPPYPSYVPADGLLKTAPTISLEEGLAVAKFFLRNKPVELTCKEYAAELRAARVRVDSPMASPVRPISSVSEVCTSSEQACLPQMKYTIDTGTYWRNRSSRLSEAKQALSDENERLEAENLQLKLRVAALESAASATDRLTNKEACKRKRSAPSNTCPAESTIASNKKICFENSRSETDDVVPSSIMETTQGQKANHAILVAVFNLQSQLRNITTAGASKALANSIGRTASALMRLSDNSPSQQDATGYFKALNKTAGLLFRGLVAFDKCPNSCQNGSVIFAMTQLFRSMMTRLWDYPKPWPIVTSSNTPPASQVLARLRPEKTPNTQTKLNACKEPDNSLDFRERSKFLRTFIAFLATHASSSPTIAELAEGILFLLMQRAGPLMYAISFDIASSGWSQTIEEQIRATDIQSGAPHTAEAKAHRDAQARLLMPLMKQALSAYLCNPRSRRMYEGSVRLPEAAECGLLSRETQKIQNTLKQAIFPDSDSAYGEGIKAAREVLRMMEQEEQDMWSDQEQDAELKRNGAWFVEDLWTLVGWDVMVDYWPDSESAE